MTWPADIAGAENRAARIVGVSAVLLGTTVVPLDSSVNVDFPFITSHFGLPLPAIQWLVISYTLATASLMLVCGRAADLFGANHVFLAGCACSAAAFVLCAIAPDYHLLLLFRVLQGAGAGLVLSCGPALITSLHAEADRPRALGIYTAAFAAGAAVGAAVAGPLIGHLGWTIVFWFRAPLAATAFCLALALPPARRARTDRFDAPGAMLLVFTITCLVLVLNRLADPTSALPLLAATMLGAACFVRQQRRSPHPIIDLRRFRQPRFALVNLASTLLNLAAFAVPLLVPFQLMRVPHLPVALGGVVLATSSAGMVLGASAAARLLARSSPRTLLVAAAWLVAAGLLGIIAMPDRITALAGSLLVQGLGLGVFQVAYLDQVTLAMPVQERGVAGSLGMLTRTLGIVSGASLLMIVFQAVGAGAAVDADETFAAGFRAAILCAAGVAVLVGLGLVRFPDRARST